MDAHRLADLTYEEFAAAVKAGRWLLLPFGTVEEHGPHLPLKTDLLYAEHVCLAVARAVNGLAAPAVPYGVCRTMRNFPGTISLTPGTLAALVREIVAEYARHGARKLALFTGHAEAGQAEALREGVLPAVTADPDLVIVVIGPYDFLEPVRRDAGLLGKDGHAGSIETSGVLAIDPSVVRLDRVPAVTRPRLSAFRVRPDPESEFPTGVRGDTSRISLELGERANQHVIAEIVRVLRNLDHHGTEWGK
jgi:creatinine amidohydrolase